MEIFRRISEKDPGEQAATRIHSDHARLEGGFGWWG